ncbi:hypothetical protein [Brachybacterium sp. YJGR34]|uniref:hypothetical protein n=1 Tax=Brachybacterium sp. YJGR34 TaxID=2059911 RepID=UPI000E0BC03A|nr:hypothetical protein [Brachybacterium sp. YJGR34]
MSNQHVANATGAQASEDTNVTSKGNNPVLSVVLFVVLFALFGAGLYVMSLVSMDQPSVGVFLGGLGMCLLALYCTFDLVPRFLTR